MSLSVRERLRLCEQRNAELREQLEAKERLLDLASAQLETLREAVREHVESAHGQYGTDKHAKLRAALSNPASEPPSNTVDNFSDQSRPDVLRRVAQKPHISSEMEIVRGHFRNPGMFPDGAEAFERLVEQLEAVTAERDRLFRENLRLGETLALERSPHGYTSNPAKSSSGIQRQASWGERYTDDEGRPDCGWGYTGDERDNCACPVCDPASEPKEDA